MAPNELADAVRRLASRIGSQLSTAGPVQVDETMVARIREALGWPREFVTDEPIPQTMITHLFRDHLNVRRDERPRPFINEPLGQPLNGGTRYRFNRPLHIGDVVTRETYLKDVSTRTNDRGTTIRVEVTSSFSTRMREVIAIVDQATIYRCDEVL